MGLVIMSNRAISLRVLSPYVGRTLTISKWSKGVGGVEEIAAFKGVLISVAEDHCRLAVPVLGGTVKERIPFGRVIDYIVQDD